MADILTVTMNPALDVSAITPGVHPTRKLRCDQVQRHPGGGGVNVARVLQRLGADCAALCLLGGPTGELLAQLLKEESVTCLPVAVAGHTRESFTVLDSGTQQEYRFVLPGPDIHADEIQAIFALLAWQPPAQFVVASGSLPPGVPDDFYAQLTQVANSWGAKMVVDGSGAALKAALGQGVFMAKPSLREMREATGLPLNALVDVQSEARSWVDQDQAQIVVVSLGAQGALLVSRQLSLYAPPLDMHLVSAVGAGDSFVAAMVWSLLQGHDVAKAFRFGVAGGSAALGSSGTGLCAAADVHRLWELAHCSPEIPDLLL